CGIDLSESHDGPSVPIKVKMRLRSLGAVLPESIARRYPCDLRFMLFLFRVEERDHMIQSFRRFAGKVSACPGELAHDGESFPPLLCARREQRRDGGKSRFFIDHQHEVLLANERLEGRKRQPLGVVGYRADAPDKLEAALVE